MKPDNLILNNIVTGNGKKLAREFWRRAFLVYALIEIVIITIQYVITWQQCKACVLPPAFYAVSWLRHVSFAAGLWVLLNRFYYVRKWKLIVLNLAAFFAYYVLWIASSYVINNSDFSFIPCLNAFSTN